MVGPDSDRLWRRLMALGKISAPGDGVTRTSFSRWFQEGRAWLTQQFESAGLEARVDHAGNLHGRLRGRREGTVLVGGHSDTVPNGGRFDGALGVLSALEIVETLRATGVTPEYSLEVIDFLAEEPSAFGLSCIGSRGFAGTLTPTDLSRQNPDGVTLADALRRVGGNPDQLGPVDPKRPLVGYLELHIEQGPILEQHPGALGVVTDIAGIVRYRFRVNGKASHAGTTPMRDRRDALVAAGRLASRLYEAVVEVPSLVATVGQLKVTPNAVNVVPGQAEGVAEFRSADPEILHNRSQAIMAGLLSPDVSLGCQYDFEEYMRTTPVPMSDRLQLELQRAITATGSQALHLFSGAGHDAVELASRTEVGMMFSPCKEGLSHCPEEWVEPSDISRALAAYDRAVRALVGISQ
ncbi:MAG: M20 family metallo-hydrolase [Bacilli bacterium]